MITLLTGELLKKEPNYCDILTAGGVGYRVQISLNTFAALVGKTARLLTTMIIREDAHLLFGFATEEERALFELLIKVRGVGPKSALAILSTFTPEQFAAAVANGDESLLTKVPGIGKKSASLILVSLGNSINKLRLTAGSAGSNDAFLALESLGFKPVDITQALSKCTSTDTVVLIKEALKILQKVG